MACQGLINIADGALSVANRTVQAANHSLDVAKFGLTVAQKTLDGAKDVLQGAEDLLTGIEDTFKFGLDAADKISNFGLEGLITINDISFDVELNVANSASFDVSVTASFLGQPPIDLYLGINLRDLDPICRDLAEHIGEGFGQLF